VPHPLSAEVGEFIESDPTGLTAAAALNGDLIAEETQQAVADARAG
jgi:hypothetical protein